MNENLFVVPQETRSLIAHIDGDTIIESGKIDIPYTSKSVVTENGCIVSICFGQKPKASRMKIFDSAGKQLVRKTEYKYSSIACKNNAVYLGGQFGSRNSELFACIDLSDVDFTAQEIALPVISVAGKSIDDILIRNNSLILVDNIYYPKYLFQYDISAPNSPNHILTEELPNNGTYEHIVKGDINDDYLVLLSSSIGMYGAYKYITLLSGKQNVLLRYYLGGNIRRKHRNGIEKTEKNIFDIALIGDSLFILRSDGLECLDISKEFTESVTAPTRQRKPGIKSLKDYILSSGNVTEYFDQSEILSTLNSGDTPARGIKQKTITSPAAVPITCGIEGKRLIKTPDNRLLVINKNEYELITENKARPFTGALCTETYQNSGLKSAQAFAD
jgi:hypothetical protein